MNIKQMIEDVLNKHDDIIGPGVEYGIESLQYNAIAKEISNAIQERVEGLDRYSMSYNMHHPQGHYNDYKNDKGDWVKKEDLKSLFKSE